MTYDAHQLHEQAQTAGERAERHNKIASRLLIIAGVGLAFAAGGAVGSGLAPAPDECVAAIDVADEIMSVHEDVARSAAEAVGYAADWDYRALDAETEKVNGYVAELDELRPGYYDDSEACRG